MNKDLVSYLIKHKLIDEYGIIIDWILDDNKFDNLYWNQRKTIKFTNQFKKYCNIHSIDYKNNVKNIIDNDTIHIYIIDKQNIKDVIRHIRNAIAHKKVIINKNKNKYYLKIISSSRNKIMSNMYIDLELLKYLYNTYKSLKKEVNEVVYS